MKNLFSWRLRPSEAEFTELWDTATFVFDTNFLLDLYRVSRRTSEDYLRVLERLRDRIWLPYQVADEFFENRENVINNEVSSFDDALSVLEKWRDEQRSLKILQGRLKQTGRIIGSEISFLFDQQSAYVAAVEEVERVFKEKIEELRSAHFSLNAEDDNILSRLLLLFDQKVGNPYNEVTLNNLYKEGEVRYKQGKPPGFADEKTKVGNKKYGDFILWKQILEFAKVESKPIIFVGRDNKEDWWAIKGGKTLFPHVELRREFQEFVQQPFWMYPIRRFLEMAKERLMVAIDQRSIEETEAIANTQPIPQQIYEMPIEQSPTPDEITRQMIERMRLHDEAKRLSFMQSMQLIEERNKAIREQLEPVFRTSRDYDATSQAVARSMQDAVAAVARSIQNSEANLHRDAQRLYQQAIAWPETAASHITKLETAASHITKPELETAASHITKPEEQIMQSTHEAVSKTDNCDKEITSSTTDKPQKKSKEARKTGKSSPPRNRKARNPKK